MYPTNNRNAHPGHHQQQLQPIVIDDNGNDQDIDLDDDNDSDNNDYYGGDFDSLSEDEDGVGGMRLDLDPQALNYHSPHQQQYPNAEHAQIMQILRPSMGPEPNANAAASPSPAQTGARRSVSLGLGSGTGPGTATRPGTPPTWSSPQSQAAAQAQAQAQRMAQAQARRQRQRRIQPHTQQPHPNDYTYYHHQHQHHHHLAIERDRKLRSRHREDRHAALCVLLDRELLMLQALAMNETLPQARRRFTSKLMAPEDPTDAAAIRADRYTILLPGNTTSSSSNNAQHVTVPRSVVDVHETGDAGWVRSGSASEGQGIGSATPSPLSRGKNRTPSSGRMAASPSQQRRRSGRG